MIIAKRQLSKTSIDDMYDKDTKIETIKNIVKQIKDIDEKKLIEFIDMELADNDSEENYFEYGVAYTFGDELYLVNVENFIKGLKKWIESEQEEEPDEDDQSYYMDTAKELVKDLEKYIDYDFYFEEDKKDGNN